MRRQVVAQPRGDSDLIPTYNFVDYDMEAEIAWDHFAPQCLKWAPSGPELLQRWYRHRLTKFIREEFRRIKQDPPRPLGSEDLFFKLYPYLQPKWLKEKRKAEVIAPTAALLLDRWFKQRKYEFKKNWLKKNRSGNKYNFANQKVSYANRGSLCNYQPRMTKTLFWFNNFAVICILVILVIILWKKTFKIHF